MAGLIGREWVVLFAPLPYGDFSSPVGQVTMAVRIRGAGSAVGLDGSLFVGIPVRLHFVRLRVA